MRRVVSSRFLDLSIVDPQRFAAERAERERVEQERVEQGRVDQEFLFRRLRQAITATSVAWTAPANLSSIASRTG